MEYVSSLTNTIIPFLFVLTALVFVHELGHFLLARWNGVKVEVFSVGFGKELWGFNDKQGTRWRLSAVPLGGYVKMFGEGDVVTGVDDTEDRPMTEEEKKVSFHHKRLGQRAAIVAAGPVANFLFAFLVFWVINVTLGAQQLQSVVGEVMADSAAQEAGFQAGDEIISVNGKNVQYFNELVANVTPYPNVPLEFKVVRDNTILTLIATPRPVEGGDGRGLLGVRSSPESLVVETFGLFDGMTHAASQTYAYTASILSGLGEMFSGAREAKELGGIISIATFSGQAAQAGIGSILGFLAILSINLGLINLFPIPVLDGGHLVFYAAEALRGKPLSQKLQEYSFRFGLVLVLLLMIFATWNDLGRLFDKLG